jgi:hypothetical protein
VPSLELAYTDFFGRGSRPYLAMQVTGINGQSGPIVGLLDSGADTTALPTGYAALMGYQAAQLERIEVGTAKGSGHGWRAVQPCTATVAGATPPFLTLSLNPIFVETAHPLWGRRDVMAMFTAVAIEETAQRFTLTF